MLQTKEETERKKWFPDLRKRNVHFFRFIHFYLMRQSFCFYFPCVNDTRKLLLVLVNLVKSADFIFFFAATAAQFYD